MTSHPSARPDPGWWERWPWRLIQTNLREVDMRDIDAERYVASLKGFNATVAMVNTSGIIASYPTRLPFHAPSAFLQGNSLETIIEACHAAGIKVIARTDFSKVRRALFERHPEWAYRRSDGPIVDEEGDVHVCPSGAYQQECAPRIVEETITTLDVDGIYFNMAGFQTRDYRGTYHGICHCRACVDGFREQFGLALPSNEDREDPVYRRYLVFQQRTLRAWKERIDALIRELRPDLAIERPTDGRGGFVRQESNTSLDRSPPDWRYGASANTKWVLASLPRTVSSNSSVDFIDFPVRHVSVSPDRQRCASHRRSRTAARSTITSSVAWTVAPTGRASPPSERSSRSTWRTRRTIAVCTRAPRLRFSPVRTATSRSFADGSRCSPSTISCSTRC